MATYAQNLVICGINLVLFLLLLIFCNILLSYFLVLIRTITATGIPIRCNTWAPLQSIAEYNSIIAKEGTPIPTIMSDRGVPII